MYQPSKDMKSLGFCSIYKESFNIISSNRKLFTQIAIFLTLPLHLISFLFSVISAVDPSSTSNPPAVSPWTNPAFLAFNLAYAVLSTGLSLLNFSSVTYSVACIYTEHTDITFKTTLCAFKKVWKKLVLTYLAEWILIFGYMLLIGLLLIAPMWTVSSRRYQVIGSVAIFIIAIVSVGGLIYISIVWIFSRTVANLETTYGFKALSKSKSLIKGKAWGTILVLLPISLCSAFVGWIFLKVVINGGLNGLGLVTRIGCGVACLPVMVGLTVFGVVALTVTYFVCKADKKERITKSDVMDHLDIFVDGYSPILQAKDEQI